MRLLPIALSLLPALALAAQPTPEIAREAGKPQAVGVVHTVRGIPEACARIEGVFTGEAASAYRFSLVKTHPQCQPRARLVDFAKARPSIDKGWKLNDRIVVTREGCASQQAVVHVWRKPGSAAPPGLDAQGRSRIYLEEAKAQAKADGGQNVTAYAVQMEVVPGRCAP